MNNTLDNFISGLWIGEKKFIPDNDKKETFFFFFLENESENANKECKKREINIQNKLDMLFQLFQAIGITYKILVNGILLTQPVQP